MLGPSRPSHCPVSSLRFLRSSAGRGRVADGSGRSVVGCERKQGRCAQGAGAWEAPLGAPRSPTAAACLPRPHCQQLSRSSEAAPTVAAAPGAGLPGHHVTPCSALSSCCAVIRVPPSRGRRARCLPAGLGLCPLLLCRDLTAARCERLVPLPWDDRCCRATAKLSGSA